ncbi:MAG: hypothetical protein ACXWXO_11475, partial [Nocardioides sp.]
MTSYVFSAWWIVEPQHRDRDHHGEDRGPARRALLAHVSAPVPTRDRQGQFFWLPFLDFFLSFFSTFAGST